MERTGDGTLARVLLFEDSYGFEVEPGVVTDIFNPSRNRWSTSCSRASLVYIMSFIVCSRMAKVMQRICNETFGGLVMSEPLTCYNGHNEASGKTLRPWL